MDKNTPDVRAGFLPDRVSVDTAVIPQIFAVLRHDFAINSVLLLVLLHLLYWPCSSMEGSKLGGCFHLPAPCTLNIYKYICEEKCCKGLCTSSSLTTRLHSRVSAEWFVYKWRSSLLQSMLGGTVRGRPSMLPSWGSPRRCVLVDMEALGGELLVAGSQEALQPPGSLWLSMWHFTLLLPLHVWRVL